MKIPLVLDPRDPQPEGGYTVTSPLLPELITEGDTAAEALANAEDASAAVVEIYEDQGHPCHRASTWTTRMAQSCKCSYATASALTGLRASDMRARSSLSIPSTETPWLTARNS